MDEFFVQLLLGFAELILELAAEGILDLLLRAIGEVFAGKRRVNPVLAALGYVCLGIGGGGLSLLPFPHRLAPRSRVHGVSLFVIPVLTGLFMSMLGAALRRRGKRSTRIESFWYGFAFAFGMALVRFLFVRS